MSPPLDLDRLRRTVALACRIMGHAGLAQDILGHVSVRVDDATMLVRCRGPEERGLLFTVDDDIKVVDFDGRVEAADGWAPPSELPIHAEVLRARADVDAVVHCHPPSVLVAGIAGIELRPLFGAYNIPATRLALDGIPTYPRAVLVRRAELGRELVAAMGSAPACVLRGHGIVTVGSGPHAIEQAMVRALNLEVLAAVNLQVQRVAPGAAAIPPQDVAELPDLGSAFNDLLVWNHHVARLRHAGLALD